MTHGVIRYDQSRYTMDKERWPEASMGMKGRLVEETIRAPMREDCAMWDDNVRRRPETPNRT